MPGDESTLDFDSILINKLCTSLTGPSTTDIHVLADHPSEAEELHSDDGSHNLGFPEDDHDGHGDDDHDDHDHDDHDDHGDREDHDGHDHGDHDMLMPEDSLEASSDCPTGTVISVYHFEAGEYMLEFEGEDVETFMMAIAQMGGAHHHHDHGDHGDDDHDDHSDDDHDDHDEHCVSVTAGEVAPADGTFTYSDGTTIDVETGAVAPEDGLYCVDHDEEMHAEDVMAMFDSNNDNKLSLEEFLEGMESMEDDHDDHDGHDDHGDDDNHADDDHDDHDDDNSNYYDGCFVSTDPNDGHYECWMEDWRDEDGNLTNTDGYDEDECTELSNSTWECEHHEDDHDDHWTPNTCPRRRYARDS